MEKSEKSEISESRLSIATRMRTLRASRRWQQSEMADALGTSYSNYTKLEIGRNQASDDIIAAAAREFGVSEAWIRTGEGQGVMEQPGRHRVVGNSGNGPCRGITCDQVQDVVRILMDDDVVGKLKASAADLGIDEVEIAMVYVRRKLEGLAK
jgi:DNA-binding XRE family transcriptional regulator